jgi:galactokinase
MGGVVLPAAIDRHVTVSGLPAAEWSVESEVAGGLAYARAAGAELGIPAQSLRVTSQVPPGAGLASSAAFLVAIAAGLRPDLTGERAALAAQRAEHRATGVDVGIMDQFAAALGRRGHALLLDCATREHSLVTFPPDVAIAVLDSGQRRSLAVTPYSTRRREAEAGMPRRRRHVESEVARVREFVAALGADRLGRLGELLKASHRSLRDDFEVSTPLIDALVERAWRTPGCLGARIMGAGFGGCILALVRGGSEGPFRAALEGVPVLFCATADGAFRR